MAVAVRERAESMAAPAWPRVSLGRLEAERVRLELRLEAGLRLIDAARERGERVEHLEAHWRDLLHAYEQLSTLALRCRATR